jgi:hypothetical protein
VDLRIQKYNNTYLIEAGREKEVGEEEGISNKLNPIYSYQTGTLSSKAFCNEYEGKNET